MKYRVFDIEEIDNRQAYRLCVGSIVPRPISWVSSIDLNGVANLAPTSHTIADVIAPNRADPPGERRKA